MDYKLPKNRLFFVSCMTKYHHGTIVVVQTMSIATNDRRLVRRISTLTRIVDARSRYGFSFVMFKRQIIGVRVGSARSSIDATIVAKLAFPTHISLSVSLSLFLSPFLSIYLSSNRSLVFVIQL